MDYCALLSCRDYLIQVSPSAANLTLQPLHNSFKPSTLQKYTQLQVHNDSSEQTTSEEQHLRSFAQSLPHP